MGDTFLGSFDLDLGKYLERRPFVPFLHCSAAAPLKVLPSARVARDSDALTIGPSDITFYDGEQAGSRKAFELSFEL